MMINRLNSNTDNLYNNISTVIKTRSYQLFQSDNQQVNEILQFLFNQDSKNLRPIFVFLAATAAGEVNDLTTNCAVLIEALHTASLLHDDIIDIGTSRRGASTINVKYDNKTAVLAGDYILSRSLKILATVENPRLTKIFSAASENICLGEIEEQHNKHNCNLTLAKYLTIVKKKTAALFIASSRFGVESVNGSSEIKLVLEKLGEYFGIFFQLIDDLLDYRAEQAKTGKARAMDFKQKVLTAPVITALNNIDNKKRITTLFYQDYSNNNFLQLYKLIEKYKGFESTENKIREYADKCFELIKKLDNVTVSHHFKTIISSNLMRIE